MCACEVMFMNSHAQCRMVLACGNVIGVGSRLCGTAEAFGGQSADGAS
jgi:hypothetical protein